MICVNTDSRIVRMASESYGRYGTESLMMYEAGSDVSVIHIPGLPAGVAKATADAFNKAIDAERGQHADDTGKEEVA